MKRDYKYVVFGASKPCNHWGAYIGYEEQESVAPHV